MGVCAENNEQRQRSKHELVRAAMACLCLPLGRETDRGQGPS